MDMFVDNHIECEDIARKKLITGTRLATVLGVGSKWAGGPCTAWSEIMRVFAPPFTGSKYTEAGRAIEPIIRNYLRRVYGLDVLDPDFVFGNGTPDSAFKATWGDYYHGSGGIFGGMWDGLVHNDDGTETIVEIKTANIRNDVNWIKTEDCPTWYAPDVAVGQPLPPIYYCLQVCIYAYLQGTRDCLLAVSFLNDDDYPIELGDGTFDTSPSSQFVPSVANTHIFQFKIEDMFPDFEKDVISKAQLWYDEHCKPDERGVCQSPDYDEELDSDMLTALRTKLFVPEDDSIASLIKEADELQEQVESVKHMMASKEARLAEINGIIKQLVTADMGEHDTKVKLLGDGYEWTVSKRDRVTFDKSKLADDHPEIDLDMYELSKSSFTLTKKKLAQ